MTSSADIDPTSMEFFDLEFEYDDRGNRIGVPVQESVCHRPEWKALGGRYARLEPLARDSHTEQLFAAFEGHDRVWTYMPHGPFATEGELAAWIESVERLDDPMFFAVIDVASGEAVGIASYLRIDEKARSIEVGWISLSPRLQRSTAASEAMYLMMRNAFELGFRRYEWKCNALNVESMVAAERLGMTFEGVFRKATVVKGRNRDTAWFAIVDDDWPGVRAAMETWLAPGNFDASGRQLSSLSDATREFVYRSWRP